MVSVDNCQSSFLRLRHHRESLLSVVRHSKSKIKKYPTVEYNNNKKENKSVAKVQIKYSKSLLRADD
jgi:hypothetical protein